MCDDNMNDNMLSLREENMRVRTNTKAAPENETEPWLEPQIVLELVLEETPVLYVDLPG